MTKEINYKERLEKIVGAKIGKTSEGIHGFDSIYDSMFEILEKDMGGSKLAAGWRYQLEHVTSQLSVLAGDDSKIAQFREDIAPYKNWIVDEKNYRNLDDIFRSYFEHWDALSKGDEPGQCGHFVTDRVREINIRINLGELGIIDPIDDCEYEQAHNWLQKSVIAAVNGECRAVCGYTNPDSPLCKSEKESIQAYYAQVHEGHLNHIEAHFRNFEEQGITVDDLNIDVPRVRELVLAHMEKQYSGWGHDPTEYTTPFKEAIGHEYEGGIRNDS